MADIATIPIQVAPDTAEKSPAPPGGAAAASDLPAFETMP